MRFDDLFALLKDQPYFDIAMVVQLAGEPRHTVRTQLSRWAHSGKILRLRRGMYAFADTYRALPISPAALSNELYRPSYLSLLWALGHHGLIPERVTVLTAVTSRVPREFKNALGVFRYFNVKQALFFGYEPAQMGGQRVLIATPEKALLDLWHLQRGEWTRERMIEMRYQNLDVVDEEKLSTWARAFDSPRVSRALEQWGAMRHAEEGEAKL
jgi:predicted transcriptional regulator of viral defense system